MHGNTFACGLLADNTCRWHNLCTERERERERERPILLISYSLVCRIPTRGESVSPVANFTRPYLRAGKVRRGDGARTKCKAESRC